MKKKLFNISMVGLAILFILSGCIEPRFNHRRPPARPHGGNPPAVDVRIHN